MLNVNRIIKLYMYFNPKPVWNNNKNDFMREEYKIHLKLNM